MQSYVIRGGSEGKDRLAILARILEPTTSSLLDLIGIRPGMRCLDVGSGGGHVSLALARRVGPTGQVLGIDRDPAILELARQDGVEAGLTWLDFRQADAGSDLGTEAFDLVYARFLLSHVSDVPGVLAGLHRAMRPGGLLVVEDIDFTGHVCHPPCRAHADYVDLYRAVVRARGADADLGPRLPRLMLETGLSRVEVRIVQPVALEGETKRMGSLTLERIADALLTDRLVSPGRLEQLLDELRNFERDPLTLVSLPRIFQVWGRRLL